MFSPTQWFRSQAHAMFQTENIYSSLTPIYYLTKVMGFAPFKLNGKTTKIYSAFHLLWSSFLIIVFGIYATFAVNTAPSEDTLVLKITDSMNIHLCIFSMCGGIFFACIFRNNMSSIVRDLDVVDKEFQGTQFDLKKSYMKTKLYLVIATCVILIYTLAMLTNIFLEHLTSVDYLTFGVTLAYSAPLFPILPLAQFSTFAVILRKRFMWINERMEKVGLQQKLKKTSGSSEKEHLLALIQDLGDKHHKLCTISKKLNKVYAAQILLFMMQAFLMLVTVSFFLIKTYYLRSFSAITIYENIYYPNMLIFHIILLLTVTLICASTTKEARKAGTILHNVVPMYAFSSANCLDLGAACFSLQLLHHNVKFTACRLFPIDETLLYTVRIVGAATTYLVIVLQFEFGVSGANTQQLIKGYSTSDDNSSTDNDLPEEIQHAICKIATQDIEASANATIRRELKGVCTSNEIMKRFDELEEKLLNEIESIKVKLRVRSVPLNRPQIKLLENPSSTTEIVETTKFTTTETTKTFFRRDLEILKNNRTVRTTELGRSFLYFWQIYDFNETMLHPASNILSGVFYIQHNPLQVTFHPRHLDSHYVALELKSGINQIPKHRFVLLNQNYEKGDLSSQILSVSVPLFRVSSEKLFEDFLTNDNLIVKVIISIE
ncbi:hypothetical protein FQR65_LT05547 [Abscondita terminalis]|nr:hypothetical protein FQR65_LT05547 [Abscondita terminalis]